MKIFLDIGNSFVKIARLQNGALAGDLKAPSAEFIKNPLKYLDNYYLTDSKVYIASVLKESLNFSLVEKLTSKGFICTIIKVREEFNGFKTLYNSETLGVDEGSTLLRNS